MSTVRAKDSPGITHDPHKPIAFGEGIIGISQEESKEDDFNFDIQLEKLRSGEIKPEDVKTRELILSINLSNTKALSEESKNSINSKIPRKLLVRNLLTTGFPGRIVTDRILTDEYPKRRKPANLQAAIDRLGPKSLAPFVNDKVGAFLHEGTESVTPRTSRKPKTPQSSSTSVAKVPRLVIIPTKENFDFKENKTDRYKHLVFATNTYHAFSAAGWPVKISGELYLDDNDEIISINDKSGGYNPAKSIIFDAKTLKRIDSPTIVVEYQFYFLRLISDVVGEGISINFNNHHPLVPKKTLPSRFLKQNLHDSKGWAESGTPLSDETPRSGTLGAGSVNMLGSPKAFRDRKQNFTSSSEFLALPAGDYKLPQPVEKAGSDQSHTVTQLASDTSDKGIKSGIKSGLKLQIFTASPNSPHSATPPSDQTPNSALFNRRLVAKNKNRPIVRGKPKPVSGLPELPVPITKSTSKEFYLRNFTLREQDQKDVKPIPRSVSQMFQRNIPRGRLPILPPIIKTPKNS